VFSVFLQSFSNPTELFGVRGAYGHTMSVSMFIVVCLCRYVYS